MEPGRVVAVVQARMGSARLPGKVMRDLAGEPMLRRVVNRVDAADTVDETIVATSTRSQDDRIVEECEQQGWNHVRGPEQDVLERYRKALEETADANAIVRVTADCPFIDPTVVDRVVQAYVEHQPRIDYCANTIEPRTFPRGMDTEVVSAEAIREVAEQAANSGDREHVTPFIRRHPSRFPQHAVRHEEDLSRFRLTVDEESDLELARRLWEHFDGKRPQMTHIVAYLLEHPELAEVNKDIQQKEVN